MLSLTMQMAIGTVIVVNVISAAFFALTAHAGAGIVGIFVSMLMVALFVSNIFTMCKATHVLQQEGGKPPVDVNLKVALKPLRTHLALMATTIAFQYFFTVAYVVFYSEEPGVSETKKREGKNQTFIFLRILLLSVLFILVHE
ncbi:uncharacterized protein LOC135370292 isoform X3 [Ornithodoros turicata]|uniref:uncharacterized protein LOC135370292 isoform X3 n=1 Tax=Ornithodoros turicata TaxID=34597 RepID=UPI0031391DA7